MFDEVAAGYDRTNTILSVGNDRLWRRATTRALSPRPGQRILDLAAGTGTSSVAIARTGADVSGVSFVEADATALPFEDEEFDAVTISFGLRNVQDADAGLREMLRVTKPGGRLVICEFSHPTSPAISALYRFYNDRILPPVARLVSSNGDAYDYLNESIRAWSDQPALAGRIRAAGWTDVAWRNLTLGVVALHRARKPVGDGGSQPR